MSYINDEIPHPPTPPEFRRKLRMYPMQVAWLGFTILIAMLALLGVFGETFDSASAENNEVELDVQYPSRFRYKVKEPLSVMVRNNSDATIETLIITFERDYIDQFSNVIFIPDADLVTDTTYQVTLENIQPDEARFVRVELEGDDYWRHEGKIAVSDGSKALVEVTVSTIIFP